VRPRAPRIVLLALGLLGLGLIALSTLAGLGSRPEAAAAAVPSGEGPATTDRGEGTDRVQPTRPRESSLEVVERPAPAPRHLMCRSAADGSPVGGVQLYLHGRVVAGPSEADGKLTVPEEVRPYGLEAWAPGWAPTRLPARPPLPAELALEPATASLQVVVTSADPSLRIARTRLVPASSVARGDQPWTPRLQTQGPLVAGASQLPAGRYHVYVWALAADRRAPRALPRQEVELELGRTRTLEIDADAPREGERGE